MELFNNNKLFILLITHSNFYSLLVLGLWEVVTFTIKVISVAKTGGENKACLNMANVYFENHCLRSSWLAFNIFPSKIIHFNR
jgi:hypothetical protein